MLEQREKVCEVCKAADNRGLLPSRSAEHGLVPGVLSPVSTLEMTKMGSQYRHTIMVLSWLKEKEGQTKYQENSLVKYPSKVRKYLRPKICHHLIIS